MGHHHGHHHGHAHAHGPPAGSGADVRRALAWAIVLNGGFLVVEAAVGWWTGSLALLSDAAHMLSDVGALALALGAAQLARRGATIAMTFGLARAEVLGAFLNGLGLAVACGAIVFEAVHRLAEGAPEVAVLPVGIVGAIGLAINLGSAWALSRSDPDNVNVRAALAHMLADALGSVGAVAAALLVWFGLPAADAGVSLLVAALVAWGAWRVLQESGRILLQLPPPGLDLDALRREMLAVEGVGGVHDLHAWTLDGVHRIVTVHVVVMEPMSFEVATAAVLELMHHTFSVEHATVQPERPDVGCATVDCGAVEARG